MSERIRRFAAWACLAFASTVASAQTATYLHNDLSGNPALATDANGNVVWKENYRPYGERLNDAPAEASSSVGFAGKPFDVATGLSYAGARYYDPTIGRFMGVDPAPADPGDWHGFNRYAYANNNPYKYVDPDGHSPIDVAFLLWDIGKLGVAIYNGAGVGAAVADVALSAVGVVSPVPFAGQALKAARAAEHGLEAYRAAKAAEHGAEGFKSAQAAVHAAETTTASELRAAGRSDFRASRKEELAASGGVCTYCGKPGNVGDHVKPLKSFADDVNAGKISKAEAVKQANSRQNILTACTSCNASKGAEILSKEAGPGRWVAPNGFHRD